MTPLPQSTQSPRTPQVTRQARQPQQERTETPVPYVTPQRDSFVHPVSGRRIERTSARRELNFEGHRTSYSPENQQARPQIMARPRLLTYEPLQRNAGPQRQPQSEAPITPPTPPSPSPRRLSAAARELEPGFVTPPPRYTRLDGIQSTPGLTWSTDQVIHWARPLLRSESPCPPEGNRAARTAALNEAHRALAEVTNQPSGEVTSFAAQNAGPLLRR